MPCCRLRSFVGCSTAMMAKDAARYEMYDDFVRFDDRRARSFRLFTMSSGGEGGSKSGKSPFARIASPVQKRHRISRGKEVSIRSSISTRTPLGTSHFSTLYKQHNLHTMVRGSDIILVLVAILFPVSLPIPRHLCSTFGSTRIPLTLRSISQHRPSSSLGAAVIS